MSVVGGVTGESLQSALADKRARIGDLLKVVRGVTYKKEDARHAPGPGLLPVLRATNIQAGLEFDGLVYVPARNISLEQRLRKGDIVIAASSGSLSIVGKAARLHHDWEGSFGAFCFGLRPNDGVDSRYLAWFLQTTEYRNQVSALAAGVNINNLRASHIEELTIPMLATAEQEKIVALLDEQASRLDAGVEALKRAQANLKRYRASVLKAACEGRLVSTEAELARQASTSNGQHPTYESGQQLLARILDERRRTWTGKGKYKEPAAPDTSNLPKLPEGWTWASVEQLSPKVVDGTHFKPTYCSSGVAFISVKDVRGGNVHFDDCKFISQEDHDELVKRCDPQLNDILITKSGTIGRMAVIRTERPFSLFVSVALVKTLKTTYNVTFLKLALEHYIAGINISQDVKGGLMKNLHLEDLRIVRVVLPPLLEQERIVAEVERRLSVADALEATLTANLRRATRLRQAVLQRAFSNG